MLCDMVDLLRFLGKRLRTGQGSGEEGTALAEDPICRFSFAADAGPSCHARSTARADGAKLSAMLHHLGVLAVAVFSVWLMTSPLCLSEVEGSGCAEHSRRM